MNNPTAIGVVMVVCGGFVLLAWLVFSWWDVGRRGERSGAISKVGYALLEANVGRKRKQQITALIVIAIVLIMVAVGIYLVMRSEQHSWSQWGA